MAKEASIASDKRLDILARDADTTPSCRAAARSAGAGEMVPSPAFREVASQHRRGCAKALADDQARDYCDHDMTLRVLDHEEPEGRTPRPPQSPDRGLGRFTAQDGGRRKPGGVPRDLTSVRHRDWLAAAPW